MMDGGGRLHPLDVIKRWYLTGSLKWLNIQPEAACWRIKLLVLCSHDEDE